MSSTARSFDVHILFSQTGDYDGLCCLAETCDTQLTALALAPHH